MSGFPSKEPYQSCRVISCFLNISELEKAIELHS